MQQNIWRTFRLKLNKNNILILLLVGILLVVIAIPTSENQCETEYGTEIEIRLENILEKMEGVGEVKVMVTYQDNDEVEGIAVIADGGGDSVIVKNITEVVQALFDVESHKIKVIKAN